VSLASVGAAVGGVAWMGIVGAAAVLFTAQLVMLFVVLPVSLRNLDEPSHRFLALIARPPVAFLVRALRAGAPGKR
ncbi:MAG: hypothetical protein ACTSRY_07040, partial [Alphaproteobacteria bacterium]